MSIVCFTGTSIEHNPGSYCEFVEGRLGQFVHNYALGGGSFCFPNSLGQTILTLIDQAIADFKDEPVKHMHIGGPFNDLMGLYAGQVKQLTDKVMQAALTLKNNGWTVTAGAILPFCGGTAIPEAYYSTLLERKNIYNNWGATYFAGSWVDLSWNLRETRDYDRADYRFFADGLHPNELGNMIAGHDFPIAKLMPAA